jgi:hypothetical protein
MNPSVNKAVFIAFTQSVPLCSSVRTFAQRSDLVRPFFCRSNSLIVSVFGGIIDSKSREEVTKESCAFPFAIWWVPY